MNFTREPIIETIVTPRDGCRLVVRNSKGPSHEEYTVEALEVVSFGQSLFFRSLERPKCFLVPVSDYEVIEVKETRMVLKAGPLEKGVKIGGGREAHAKPAKDKVEEDLSTFEMDEEEGLSAEAEPVESSSEVRPDKKRDRRRNRRRKGRSDEKEPGDISKLPPIDEMSESYAEEHASKPHAEPSLGFSSLIPPPATLISENLAAYKSNAEYRKAFFDAEEPVEDEKPEEKEGEKGDSLPPLPFPDEF